MLYIGTSGYSYRDWIGPVYPLRTKPADFLTHYSQKFGFTEINSSYYQIPSEKTTASMARRTPADFRFSIKAHRSLTHLQAGGPARDNDGGNQSGIGFSRREHEALTRFLNALGPLVSEGKLSAILFQFPYSFHYTETNRRYLYELLSETGDQLLSLIGRPQSQPPLPFVEFRNLDWMAPSVGAGLTALGAGGVWVDTPELSGLPGYLRPTSGAGSPSTADASPPNAGPPDIAARPPVYIRFHGRNTNTWWNGTNATRYDYLYSPDEMVEIAEGVKTIAAGSSLALVAFNNHLRGNAVVNASQLETLLATTPIDQRSTQ